jgi:hypothetical protein
VDEAVEEGDARAVGPEAEVLEVAAVARVRELGVDAQHVGDVRAMRERRKAAVVVAREVVAGQVVRSELPLAALGEVAVIEAEPSPRRESRNGVSVMS